VPQQKPRLEPRLVFALALLAIPLLYLVAQVILFRAGDDCGDANHAQVGGLSQMFVPGNGCTEQPVGR
jgi:hypothetical protein